MPIHVKFCWRNVNKSLIRGTQYGRIGGYTMVARWVHIGVFGRYRFRRTPSTSDADSRPRSTICARLSRHVKIVASCYSRRTGFESQANKG